VVAGRRADSEGFSRIETRAKSNLVVLPFKLEPFNRRRSVRDRAAPLLFRIKYMPFYVAAHLDACRRLDLQQAYRVAFRAVRVDLTSCLDLKINERPLYAAFRSAATFSCNGAASPGKKGEKKRRKKPEGSVMSARDCEASDRRASGKVRSLRIVPRYTRKRHYMQGIRYELRGKSERDEKVARSVNPDRLVRFVHHLIESASVYPNITLESPRRATVYIQYIYITLESPRRATVYI